MNSISIIISNNNEFDQQYEYYAGDCRIDNSISVALI